VSVFSGPVDPVAVLTAATGLVAALGVLAKQVRDGRRERRARRRNEKSLEQVARAMAKDSEPVAEVVDELERTGDFRRPTIPDVERDG
jgi:hypothetical protein